MDDTVIVYEPVKCTVRALKDTMVLNPEQLLAIAHQLVYVLRMFQRCTCASFRQISLDSFFVTESGDIRFCDIGPAKQRFVPVTSGPMAHVHDVLSIGVCLEELFRATSLPLVSGDNKPSGSAQPQVKSSPALINDLLQALHRRKEATLRYSTLDQVLSHPVWWKPERRLSFVDQLISSLSEKQQAAVLSEPVIKDHISFLKKALVVNSRASVGNVTKADSFIKSNQHCLQSPLSFLRFYSKLLGMEAGHGTSLMSSEEFDFVSILLIMFS